MLRDPNKTDVYFTNYLAEQEKRIHRFNEKLNKLIKEHKPEEKIQQCHGFIARMLHDKLYAQYSLGFQKEELRNTFSIYINHVKLQNQLTYQDAMEAISLSIVFNCSIQSILSAEYIPADDLLKTMYFWNGESEIHQANNGLMFPNISKVFLETLQGRKSGTELRRYIQENWYFDNCDASWFNANQRSDGTYYGYWCFLGAAVVVIKKFDKQLFEGCPYFPIDVL